MFSVKSYSVNIFFLDNLLLYAFENKYDEKKNMIILGKFHLKLITLHFHIPNKKRTNGDFRCSEYRRRLLNDIDRIILFVIYTYRLPESTKGHWMSFVFHEPLKKETSLMNLSLIWLFTMIRF